MGIKKDAVGLDTRCLRGDFLDQIGLCLWVRRVFLHRYTYSCCCIQVSRTAIGRQTYYRCPPVFGIAPMVVVAVVDFSLIDVDMNNIVFVYMVVHVVIVVIVVAAIVSVAVPISVVVRWFVVDNVVVIYLVVVGVSVNIVFVYLIVHGVIVVAVFVAIVFVVGLILFVAAVEEVPILAVAGVVVVLC